MPQNQEKIKNNPEEEIKQEVKEEKESAEIEEESSPWKELELEEEENLIEKYQEESELSDKTKEGVDQVLHEEIDQKRISFAQEWFKNNKDKVKSEGYDWKNTEEGYVVKITNELGGFQEMKQDEEYQEIKEEIDNLYALRKDFKKDSVPVETQFLVLNFLNQREKRVNKEYEKAKGDKDESLMTVKEQQLKEISNLREDIGKKVSGRNFEKEAGKKLDLSALPEKDIYVDNTFKATIDKVEKGIKEKYPEEGKDYQEETVKKFTNALGYETREKKGLLGSKITLMDKEGKIIGDYKGDKGQVAMGKVLRDRFEKEAKKELGEAWDKLKAERGRKIEKYTQEEIRKLGNFSEQAEGKIRGVYERVKDRLYTEYAKELMVKTKKTREQLRSLEKEFKGEGMHPTEFISAVVHRKEGLQNLTGNLNKDKRKINKFLGDWGLKVSDKTWKDLEKNDQGYGKSAKKSRGLLSWMFNVVFEKLETGK